jgi:hypothetical protein
MKEAPGSSETSVLTIATPRNNPEDTILLFHVLFTSVNLKNNSNKFHFTEIIPVVKYEVIFLHIS